MRRCIWCTTEKDEPLFNDEHVLNQAFGKFEGNLVLKDVCVDCNQYFGDGVDLKLGRDSIEGITRFHVGTKKVSDFKKYGPRSTTEIRFPEGPLRGTTGHFAVSPDGMAIGAAPNLAVGFAKSPDGEMEWFALDDVPTAKELVAKGYIPGCIRMQTQGEGDTEQIRAALAKKGITGFEVTSTEPPITGSFLGHAVFTVSHPEFRAVTKIAMNYLAAVTSPEIALMGPLDVARRYARHDARPPKGIVDAEVNPWSYPGEDGEPVPGHYLGVQAVGDEIIAQVCLFTTILYTVTLARGGVLLPVSFGHFFDTKSRRARPLPQALPIQLRADNGVDARASTPKKSP